MTEYAERLSHIYNQNISKTAKKGRGQFFTPSPIAKYMAGLADADKSGVSILDPGAGIGILSVALIEEITRNDKIKRIELTCYESDKQVLPYLQKVLEEAKSFLDEKKIRFSYDIREEDFALSNAGALTTNLTTFEAPKESFDVIISNPPYFKLNKKDLQIAKFKDVVSGQPNIYSLFMAISAKLLCETGEMIFITPRSFCSGLYYGKFRKWLMQKVNFSSIHLFDSRKELFPAEKVLQESIITKFTKQDREGITISKTANGRFSNKQTIKALKKDVIYKSNGHIFFRLPSDEQELRVIRELDKLPYNFYKLGLKISTGKVVAFRNRKHLRTGIGKESVPLLWMHNIKNGRIEWPVNKKGKAIAISNNEATRKLLLEAGNYLILKRFTTKEQKKRFDTALIYEEDFEKHKYFALDNMVNYVHALNQPLGKNQMRGIAKYLNLPIVELYFRILNGHTQVNANEVYALPFPSLEQLEQMGKSKEGYANLPELTGIEAAIVLKNNQQITREIHA